MTENRYLQARELGISIDQLLLEELQDEAVTKDINDVLEEESVHNYAYRKGAARIVYPDLGVWQDTIEQLSDPLGFFSELKKLLPAVKSHNLTAGNVLQVIEGLNNKLIKNDLRIVTVPTDQKQVEVKFNNKKTNLTNPDRYNVGGMFVIPNKRKYTIPSDDPINLHSKSRKSMKEFMGFIVIPEVELDDPKHALALIGHELGHGVEFLFAPTFVHDRVGRVSPVTEVVSTSYGIKTTQMLAEQYGVSYTLVREQAFNVLLYNRVLGIS